MRPDALRQTIDKMVEESIRRILPTVMNEVLIRTIAASGVLSEQVEETDFSPGWHEAPAKPRRRKAPKRRKPVREARKPAPKVKSKRPDLSELLDPSAGADFYQDPRSRQVVEDSYGSYDEDEVLEEDVDDVPVSSPIAQRLATLPPALRQLAEGLDADDDGGEMWGDDEHDSVPMSQSGDVMVDPTPIRDVDRAAKTVGIDFSRMKATIAKTSPTKPRVDREDAKAQMQFENARLKRVREKLNGGKPIE